MMGETDVAVKPWWQSKTIIGALVVLIAQVAKLFGLTLGTEDATALANDLVSLVGAGLAIYGRVVASRAIGKKPKAEPSGG